MPVDNATLSIEFHSSYGVHILDSIDNVQVILSIDKSQLEHIIKKTFGENTETQKYLSKFIDFEVNLDEGSFSDKEEFDNKFAFYLNNFEYQNPATKSYQVEEFKTEIFDGIDIRSRIEIIEKCNLLHRVLNETDKPCDFSIMCIEIFMMLVYQQGLDDYELRFDNINIFKNEAVLPIGLKRLIQTLEKEHNSSIASYYIFIY